MEACVPAEEAVVVGWVDPDENADGAAARGVLATFFLGGSFPKYETLPGVDKAANTGPVADWVPAAESVVVTGVDASG